MVPCRVSCSFHNRRFCFLDHSIHRRWGFDGYRRGGDVRLGGQQGRYAGRLDQRVVPPDRGGHEGKHTGVGDRGMTSVSGVKALGWSECGVNVLFV